MTWMFDYRIWQWTGNQIDELGRFNHDPVPPSNIYGCVDIKRQIVRPDRNPNLTEEEFLRGAEVVGVKDLLEHVLASAKAHGFRMQRSRSSIVLRRPVSSGWASFAGVYPMKSDARMGLNVGMERWIADAFGGLPGYEAPITGHFAGNRYINFIRDIDELFKIASTNS